MDVVAAKPRWRGVLHSWACWAMLSAGTLMVCEAPKAHRPWAACYVVAACLQFFISSLYHTQSWQPAMHKLLRRIDHSAIYSLIAATHTPLIAVSLSAQHAELAGRLLLRVWLAAVAGIGKTWLWPSCPKPLSAAIYCLLGWNLVPHLPLLMEAAGPHVMAAIAAGGLLYTLGALIYAVRFPDPWPLTFGFHEVFHTCVVAASVLHFAAIWAVCVRAPLLAGAA